MFINCPDCSALVATNLATGLPPQRCPRCGFGPLAPEAAATTTSPASPAPGSERPQPDKVVFIPLSPSRPAPEPESKTKTETDPESEPVPVPVPETEPAHAPEPPPQPGPAVPEPPADTGAAEPPAPPARPAPRFLARAAGATQRGGDRRQAAIAAGLAALLVIQLLLADRVRLANHAAWRPVVTALCTVLRCQLPVWRDPAAITVQQRDVRPVDGRPGVLQVSATIGNESSRAQAWPRITLTLSDIDGRALGMRTFEPAEYLLQPPANVTLASGEAAAIGLEIVEPSPHAVAFNFSFH